jgi:transposase-like protein
VFIDNPRLSNREVARRIGIHESRIRYWKKQPYWETEKQKFVEQKREILKEVMAQDKEEQIEIMRKRRKDLEAMTEGAKAIAAHLMGITNKTCIAMSKESDPVKACSKTIKAGVPSLTRSVSESVRTFVSLNRELYEFETILDHYENDESDDDDDDY